MKSVIILCGGRSKRMGKDKGSLLLNDKPMVLHILDITIEIADEIIIVLRDQEQINNYKEIINNKKSSIQIVTDKIADQGPLVGILTGLSNINSEYAQVLPCDSPFISKDFLLKMFKLAEENEFDAIVPRWGEKHIEPLHTLYKKNIIGNIDDLLKRGINDVSSLIRSLNVKYVDVEILDRTTHSFQNINTPGDLEKTKK